MRSLPRYICKRSWQSSAVLAPRIVVKERPASQLMQMESSVSGMPAAVAHAPTAWYCLIMMECMEHICN